MTIKGLKYRKLRLSQNRTQKAVASKVDIHPGHLSKIERGLVDLSTQLESKLDTILKSVEVSNGDQPAPSGVDPRNKLNQLTGKEWIQETVTVWRQKGLGSNHPETKYEKLHPAPFSYQDVARIIRFFSKPGMLVLDPFVGVGSTLKAAALEKRRGLGIELSKKWADLARLRLREEVVDDSQQDIWCMDVRDAIPLLKDGSVDLIVTSPPYWSILNKTADHKTKAVRLANGFDQSYSDSEDDLANISDYGVFLDSLCSIFEGLAQKLSDGKYFVAIVSDFKHKKRYYPFHSDIYERIDPEKLSLQGVSILYQAHKSLYPYGYPFAYVPNIHHQYILIFRRLTGHKKGVGRGKLAAFVPENLQTRINRLERMPYKVGLMASRHWGHQRHSICSFPSKMKPALAFTLVKEFTDENSVVMDPFSGCGTVPFEAALQGRKAIASDISRLAFVLSASKLCLPEEDDVQEILSSLKEHIKLSWKCADTLLMEPEIREFYHLRTAKEIIVAREFLKSETRSFTVNSTALFVTACLVHVLHGNRPYALSRRSHNIIPIPPKGEKVYKSLISSLGDKCERMLSFPLPATFREGACSCDDASNLSCEDSSVDVIITSPPFLGSTHFLRQNRIRNWFIGLSYSEQVKLRSSHLEHKKGVDGYEAVAREFYRSLKPNGLLIMHLGIVGKQNMVDMLKPILESTGFNSVKTVWENTSNLESQGRTDRGSTHVHAITVLQKR